MDCMFCSLDEFEHFEVELEDADAEMIEAAVKGKETLTQAEIEQLCPEAAEMIDDEARATLMDICVINGWDEYGQDACGKSLFDLFEAWDEAETQKMNAMSLRS